MLIGIILLVSFCVTGKLPSPVSATALKVVLEQGNNIDFDSTVNQIVKEIGENGHAELILEKGMYRADRLSIPSNITVTLKPGAQIEVARHLIIEGKVEAGLYQIFSGPGSVVFGSQSVKEIYPQWWGAKADGITDDALAIQKACLALSREGVKRLVFPAGNYLIFKLGATYTPTNNLCDFKNLNGLEIISKGARLIIDPDRPNGGRWGILFQFTDCTNVMVDGFHVEGPPLDLTKSQTGCWFLTFMGNCRNISLPYNSVKNMGCGYEFRGVNYGHAENQTDDTSKTENIDIGILEVENCRYGITCMSSGNHLNAKLIKSNGVVRSYIVWNVKDHYVNIESRNVYGSDMLIKTYRYWHRNENLRIKYTNNDSLKAEVPYPLGNPLAIQWAGYYENKDGSFTSGVMSNIQISLFCKFGPDFDQKILYFEKYGNPSNPDRFDETPDSYDRGRKLTGFSLSGSIVIQRPPGGQILDIAGPLPETSTWGLPDSKKSSPDEFVRFRIHDMMVRGEQSRFILGLNSFTDSPVVENVDSSIPFSIDNSLNGRVKYPTMPIVYKNCRIQHDKRSIQQ